jgi:ubiquitin C-terminal hydrolase
MTSDTFNRGVRHEYQLEAVIAHLGIPDHDGEHYIAFVWVFGQWIRFDDSGEAVNERIARGENFPETAASSQTASIGLSVLNTTEQAIF